jgi:hypothetical protein
MWKLHHTLVAYQKKLMTGSLRGCRSKNTGVCCRPLLRTKKGRKNEFRMQRTITNIIVLVMTGVHVIEVRKVVFGLQLLICNLVKHIGCCLMYYIL